MTPAPWLHAVPPGDGPAADAGAIEQAADAAIAAWHGWGTALEPVIGRRGFAALYQRSLQLARREHPWLPVPAEDLPTGADFSALRVALLSQPADLAATGGRALQATFSGLLARLIGEPLLARLLDAGFDRGAGAGPEHEDQRSPSDASGAARTSSVG